MQAQNDSTRILRVAAWIWIGYLIAMLMMDVVLYTPFAQQAITQNPPLQQDIPGQLLPPLGNPQLQPQGARFWPVFLFYAANGAVAFVFLLFTYWKWPQDQLGGAFYPLLVLMISATPIIINTLVVPRFPQGPLSNAEGMALRQLPVLFVALALVAWEYQLPHVIFFSVATTALELGLIAFSVINSQSVYVFIFIAIIRTITFVATGIFLNLLVTRLREQQESLRQANANLSHYASTLEQLTVSRERNRLARELHDTLAHSLTAISVSLETAKAYFDIEPKKAQEFLDKSLEATRTGVDETRRALKALRSSTLEDMGLGPAIRQAAESAASRFHLDLELVLPNPMPSLSPDVEQTLYRIAQEAIENITHHSRANKFTIRLESNGHTTLTIRDNGIGFDMRSKEPTGHFGLIGMRERAELAGGKLKIESEKGKGTKVVLTI
ncbi:sensor histidine kinase [Candidatus Villigracilis affinis]|uniref:sensor histidine kinase n=1 Tax=Candidatus Villigracilis affinis TaxID=3140682 RepID=UPI001DE24ECB|nr:sensor histidine kinase [Anaerolineales bacterium]